MGEEAFSETRLISDRGSVIVRGGYGRRVVWLGLNKRPTNDDDPDVVVELSPRVVIRLIVALAEMTLEGDEEEWEPERD